MLIALAVSASCGGVAASAPPAPSARLAATSDKPYTSLDQALADPEHVDALILSRTRLTALPPAIGKLVHLRELVMNRNADLTEIPEELGHLPELSAITALPAELSQLTRLRVLYIKGNPLPPSELERVRAALPAVTLNTDTPKRGVPAPVSSPHRHRHGIARTGSRPRPVMDHLEQRSGVLDGERRSPSTRSGALSLCGYVPASVPNANFTEPSRPGARPCEMVDEDTST